MNEVAAEATAVAHPDLDLDPDQREEMIEDVKGSDPIVETATMMSAQDAWSQQAYSFERLTIERHQKNSRSLLQNSVKSQMCTSHLITTHVALVASHLSSSLTEVMLKQRLRLSMELRLTVLELR